MNAALKDKKVAFFSLEMSKKQLQQRLLSSVSGISIHTLNSKAKINDTIPKVVKAAGVISELSMCIYDAGDITINDIRSKSYQLKKKHGLDLIVVDYCSLCLAAVMSRQGAGDSQDFKRT